MAVREEKTHQAADEDSSQTSTVPGFFAWILPALRSPRTMKTWIRCCVALAATLVLLVSRKTLNSLGQAAFFAGIMAVMMPPSVALSLFVFGIVTLLLGMLIGWAWGAAAMAAGLSVRDSTLLARQQQQAQASLVKGIPQAVQFQQFVFHGLFLDPRTSAVYGAFFFVGTFALGTLRAFIPKLAFLSIFGTISLDIICLYGPSFPTAQYTLSKIFILPACYYAAIAIATLVLIFPESLNHVWLTALEDDFIEPMAQILSHQSRALNSTPSDHKPWAEVMEKGQEARQKLIAGTDQLLGQIGTADLEISVGRLGPGDLQRISSELKSLMFRATALHAFLIFVHNVNSLHAKDDAESESESNPKAGMDRYIRLHRQVREREAKLGHDFDNLVPILESSSANLRNASEAAVAGIREWFRDCNSRRWAFLSKYDAAKSEGQHAALVAQLAALEEALLQYREVDRVQLLKPFERFFDKVTGKRLKSDIGDRSTEKFAARSLYICFVFSYALDAFADRLAKFMTIVVDLDSKRPKPRLWWPSGFGKLGRKLKSRRAVVKQALPLANGTSDDPTLFDDHVEESDDDDEPEEVKQVSKAKSYAKNPDALPPSTAPGRFFLKLGNALRFFRSPEGIFGLRNGVVSVALWIPSVCRSTAWFYYANRGLWALIMAQLGLAVYAGDQIAGFVVRITGTLIGLVVGMVVWYIGAGRGDGNPYGIVIAATVFTAPLMFARLASPPQQMMLWVMCGVTVVLVVGYSWIDQHYPVVANSGIGVSIAWKRALLVIIGFTAGFIVMMFPHPSSSRTLVRKTLAATIHKLKEILAVDVEAILAEEARARAGYQENVPFVGEGSHQKPSPKEQRVLRIAQKALGVATRLQGLAPSLQTARFEPQLQGKWPHAQYAALYAVQMKLLASLMLFTGAFVQLDPKWCSTIIHQSPYFNPYLLSDIFAKFTILSLALAGARPLPPSLPRLRNRVIYHERMAPPMPPPTPGTKNTSEASSSDTDTELDLDFAAEKVDGSSLGFEELTWDLLMDPQLPAHATALVALSNVINMVDEMAVIVRDLCGQMSFEGLAEYQNEWIGREEKAIGGDFSHRMGIR